MKVDTPPLLEASACFVHSCAPALFIVFFGVPLPYINLSLFCLLCAAAFSHLLPLLVPTWLCSACPRTEARKPSSHLAFRGPLRLRGFQCCTLDMLCLWPTAPTSIFLFPPFWSSFHMVSTDFVPSHLPPHTLASLAALGAPSSRSLLRTHLLGNRTSS